MNTESTKNFQTIGELLRWRAQAHPERLLFTFLENGETEDRKVTFRELDRQARIVAAQLHTRLEAGERALLLYPPGIDYIIGFMGCLYAGVIAVPAYPPDPARLGRTLPRLQAIAADAEASLILSIRPILQMAQFLFSQAPDLAGLPQLATDTLHDELANALADVWEPADNNIETIAFLQYTSGSTRTPKGVMLSHENLLHNAARTAEMMEITSESRIISWLPPYHDMGLIGMILQPIYRGCSCVLMSPVDFLKRPLRWLRAVSKYQGTITGGPNFAFDLCARKFDPAQESTPLDLSHLRVAFNGAEPIRPETIERFYETFSPYGFQREAFYPCYGLAEGTLIVSGVQVSDAPTVISLDKASLKQNRIAPATNAKKVVSLVGNGRSLCDQTIAIVDPETRIPVSSGQVGEIWVHGTSIAQGYWNRADETATTFAAFLADTQTGPFLRTGDLGFIQDNQLYVTGRHKDLIIVHGQNHYPQDIEITVESSHPALRPGCSAAFSVEAGQKERLVIVQEVNTAVDLDTEDIFHCIRQAVTEAHEVQAYGIVLIQPRTIFKTSSGKIQRFACRQAFLDGTLAVVAESVLDIAKPDSEVPISFLQDMLQSVEPAQQRAVLITYLRHQIADLLGLGSTLLDPTLPLSTYGINSVQAVELSQRFEKNVGRDLPATLAYDYPTINALCDYMLYDVLALASHHTTDDAQTATASSDTAAATTETDWSSGLADMTEEEATLALLQELKEFKS